MSIWSEIINWLHNRPNWQQEAAERILKNGFLSETDIDELTTLSKTIKGQEKTKTHNFLGLGTSATNCSDLYLNSIGEIEGIDNLAPRKPLEFDKTNITVIYGNNGSGKSGYTRILKKACGKPYAAELKANVFKKAPDKRCCRISYERIGKSHDPVWMADDKSISDLCEVDIFDSTCGEFYLTKENEASYSPEILNLFDKLVKACEAVKIRLENELNKLPSKLPVIPIEHSGTKAAKLYIKIHAPQTESMLPDILVWSKGDDQSLDDLEERLKTDDPEKQAKNKRNQKSQIELIISLLINAINKISPDECEKIRTLENQSKEKRNTATEGIKIIQESDSLKSVGSEAWRSLWEAAKRYSQIEAYPDLKFPNTSKDARCVLCQQELSISASKRLQSFEDFVAGTISAEAIDAETDFNNALKDLPKTLSAETILTSLQAAGLEQDLWLPRLSKAWDDISKTAEKIKETSRQKISGLKEKDYLWLEELQGLAAKLEKQAEQYDKDAKLFDRPKALADKKELLSKKWTSNQKTAIQEELKRLKQIGKIKQWINSTVTTAISKQAGLIAKELITDAYVDRFNSELKNLGAHRIKVELQKTRAPKGHALHALTLKGLNFKEHPPNNILSEGERRIVTLAAFIADVTGGTKKSPFIFDDPISSLDQDFEEKTIDRLIELSKDRQVIIFTHRLSFLGILEGKTSPKVVCVRHEPWGAGEPGEVPIYGKKPENALKNLLNERLTRAKKIFNTEGTEAYYPLAKAICSDFRIIVERFVEFVLLSDVIQRHRRDVTTKGKIEGLLKIIESDCEMIDDLMGRYSCYEHSQSAEAPVDVPSPEDLEKDILSLIAWNDEFKGRKIIKKTA